MPLVRKCLALATLAAVLTLIGSYLANRPDHPTNAVAATAPAPTIPPAPELGRSATQTSAAHEVRLAAYHAGIGAHVAEQARLEAEAEAARQAAEQAAQEAAEAAREAQAAEDAERAEQADLPPPTSDGSHFDGNCGGDLPPCYVLERESGGHIDWWNGGCHAPVGWTGHSPCGVSSASGKWQFIRSTWGGFGGYVNAADAPASVQDERARIAWDGGAGCGHWSAC